MTMYPETFGVLIIYVTSYLLLLWFFVTLDIPITRNGRAVKNSTLLVPISWPTYWENTCEVSDR